MVTEGTANEFGVPESRPLGECLTKLFPQRLQAVGYCGAWWEYRLPGGGELNWKDFLKFARTKLNFHGYVSIEHEDHDYAWPTGDVEKRKEGFVYGLGQLREAIAA